MRKKNHQPKIQQLETRQLMAADVSFSRGVLQVTMDASSPTEIAVEPYYHNNQQYVRVVGNDVDFSPRNGNLVRADQVRHIRVFGTGQRDVIDLSDVETDDFTRLASTRINGYGRGDKIIGSEVRDIVRGGRGKDFIDGQEGHDIIFGGAHDDIIYGGLGRDRIFGQSGNDDIWGNRSSSLDKEVDFIFGGSGFDEADRDHRDRYRSVERLF